jgi:hypothetical protein
MSHCNENSNHSYIYIYIMPYANMGAWDLRLVFYVAWRSVHLTSKWVSSIIIGWHHDAWTKENSNTLLQPLDISRNNIKGMNNRFWLTRESTTACVHHRLAKGSVQDVSNNTCVFILGSAESVTFVDDNNSINTWLKKYLSHTPTSRPSLESFAVRLFYKHFSFNLK